MYAVLVCLYVISVWCCGHSYYIRCHSLCASAFRTIVSVTIGEWVQATAMFLTSNI